MLVVGMRRLCRVGLAAALVTAFFVLTLVDMPPQIAELPTDLSPTPGIISFIYVTVIIFIFISGY